jgi:hypothetical protein
MANDGGDAKDWQELTALTQGQAIVVERVRLVDKDIVVEGRFRPPELARLRVEDQVFVTAFVRSHGSIKEMERIFGVSYPTIKSRLNRISQQLEFVETDPPGPAGPEIPGRLERGEILGRLQRGEIGAEEAIRALEATR